MKFLGVPYPITYNPRGLLRTQKGADQVKSDLLILLLTNPGERVMMPDFGTPLNSLIFNPNDTTLAGQAREMIINSISIWEPRITVENIEVVTQLDNMDRNDLNANDDLSERDGTLIIKINFFDRENIQDIQELRLQLPLSGG